MEGYISIMMKQEERHKQLLSLLNEQGTLSLDDGMRMLGVSPATLRRDFAELAGNGAARRIRGGLMRIPEQEAVLPFEQRNQYFAGEKRRIARAAATLVEPGETLFIDGGTTTAHLGFFLDESHQIITNSMHLAGVLMRRFPMKGTSNLVLTGGRLHVMSGLLLGAEAEASVARFHADATLLSVRGIDANALYNNNETISGIERAMIANSDRLIVLADHSKIGCSAMSKIGLLRKVHTLVTVETAENASTLSAMEERGIRVLRVQN